MSSWFNLPATNGTDLQDYRLLEQFYYALDERQRAQGSCGWLFPPASGLGYGGTVTSLSDNGDGTWTLTDSAASWSTASGCTGSRWYGYVCEDFCYVPVYYDVLIVGDNETWPTYPDPRKTVRCQVLGSTSNTLKIQGQPLLNAVAAGFIASTASLVGRSYHILKRSTGLYPSDRLPPRPNDQEVWRGTVAAGWTATLSYNATSQQYTISNAGGFATYPSPPVFYIATPSGGGAESNGTLVVADSAGHVTGASLTPTLDGATLSLAPPTLDTTTGNAYSGIGQLSQFVNDFNPDPYNLATAPLVAWMANQFVGMDCLAFDTTGLLHRASIVGGTSDVLFFGKLPSSSTYAYPPSPVTLTGKFLIVAAGAEAMPGRTSSEPFAYFAGITQAMLSHDVNDSINSFGIPASSASWEEGDPDGSPPTPCTEVSHSQGMDFDYQVPIDDPCECARAGDYFAPEYWTTYRALQAGALSMGGAWIDPGWAGGSDPPKPLVPAYLLYVAGINAWTATMPSGSGSSFNVGVGPGPADVMPATVYYAIWINGSWSAGTASLAADGTLSVGYTTATAGATIYLSYGFDRYYPREFSYLYPKTCWIASCDAEDGCTDPPEVKTVTNEDGSTSLECDTGMWVMRPASSTFKYYTPEGVAGDSGIAFTVGTLARYVGDSFFDPFSGEGLVEAGQDPPDPTQPYWDHFYRGKFSKAIQTTRQLQTSGTVTGSTLYSVTDTTKGWFADGINQGGMVTVGGTATGGTATSLTDSTTQVTPITNANSKNCWWDTSRFVGIEPYQSFILELYPGGLPGGWSIDWQGRASYTAPSIPSGGSTTPNAAPAISSITDASPFASGHAQTLIIAGNNFQGGCSVTIVDVTNGVTYANVATTGVGAAGVSVSFNFGFAAGSWSVQVANAGVDGGGNPTTFPSNMFAFSTRQMHFLPITASSAGTLSFATVAGLSSVNSGDGYLIREPKYELNKWQNRWLQVTPPGSTTATQVQILYSDNDTLYFAPQASAFPAGSKYAIVEYGTGTVWQFASAAPTDATLNYLPAPGSGYWVQPSGIDSRGGVPFKKDQTANLPTHVHAFGLYLIGDYSGPWIPNQLQAVIKLQHKRKVAGAWSGTCEGAGGCGYSAGGSSSGYDGDAPMPQDQLAIAWAMGLGAGSPGDPTPPAECDITNTSGGPPYITKTIFGTYLNDPADEESNDGKAQYASIAVGTVARVSSCYNGTLSGCFNASIAVESYAYAYNPQPSTGCEFSEFDAEGDPFTENEYTQFDSATTDSTGYWQGSLIGDASGTWIAQCPKMIQCTDTSGSSPGWGLYAGYQIKDTFALVDYDSVFQYT